MFPFSLKNVGLLFAFIFLASCNGLSKEEKELKVGFFLKITSHDESQYVNTKTVNISGAYSLEEGVEPNSVIIKNKNDEAIISPDLKFELKDVELKLGKNKIDLKLFVNGEVKAMTSILLFYSDFYVEILSPQDGQVFRSEKFIDVTGVYEYPQGINPKDLTINIDSRHEASLNGDGTFNYKNYELKKGTHKLTAKIYLKHKEKYRDINEVKLYKDNEAPKAKIFITPSEGKSPISVTIDGSESSDVDGSIARYIWDLGDGTKLETINPVLNHTYRWILRGCEGETRDHVVTLQVIDNDGGVSKPHKKIVTVECEPNSPPVVGNDQSFQSTEDHAFSFSLNPATDVDNDPVTYQLVSGPNVGTINNCLNGTSSIQCEYIPLANYFGTVTFTYKASDGLADSDTYATVTINLAPVNDIPEMRGNQVFATNEDTSLDFTLTGATDIDGDTLKYRIVTSPQNGVVQDCIQNNGDLTCRFIPNKDFYGEVVLTYIANDGQVDAAVASSVTINVLPINDAPVIIGNQFLQGIEDEILSFALSGATDVEQSVLKYTIVNPPSNGTISNCLSGTNDLTCDFTPNKDFNGQVTFTYKANDGIADSLQVATVNISIAPVNDRPVIGTDQSLKVNEDTTLDFSLISATDVDDDSLKYRIISAPSEGTLSGCADGSGAISCVYTPPKDFHGTVKFSYAVNDGHVDAASVANVEIDIVSVNDVPEIGSNQMLATSEDVSFEFNLNPATDIDGDTLTYSIVTSPVSGTLSGCGEGTTSNRCSYEPAKDYNGQVRFTYKVNDGQSDSTSAAEVIINIAPVNDAPVIGADQSINGSEDTPLSFNLNQAIDVEGDPLTYEIVNPPLNGTLQNCLNGTSNLWCSFFPAENFNGTIEFSYKVKDPLLESATVAHVTLNLAPVNDVPIMPTDQTFEVNEDHVLAINLSSATDIESDSLTYSVVSNPSNGTLSNCLNGTVDLACDFTPNKDFAGHTTFTYKANDGSDDSASLTTVAINVLPVNDPPLMGADQNFEMNENTTLSFDVSPASDVEDDTLTYKVIVPPGEGLLTNCLDNDTDLSCTFTPSQNFSGEVVIRYRAHDGVASTEKLGTITIKVHMVNSAPVMAANANIELYEDQDLEFDVPAATDVDGDTLTYKLVNAPTVGALTNCLESNNDLSCRYSPPKNFNGLVTFTYQANDSRLDSISETEMTLNVLPVNDPPSVSEDQSLALNENSSLKFTLIKGVDVDGDEITYSQVAAPIHGQIIGCTDSTSSIECEYIPNTDFRGTDFFIYKVNDGVLDSLKTATVSLTINKINKAPVLTQIPPFETNEDVAFIIVLPPATDVDVDPLSYWIGVTPANGKLENCLNGTSHLTCTFTPEKDFNGEVTFSYLAFDGYIKSSESHVKINVKPVNDPPVTGLNQEFIFNEDQNFSFEINKAADVDDNESLITYSIITPPGKGSLSNCLNFTNDLTCDYVPEKDFSGEVAFTYTASDGNSFSLEVGTIRLNIQPSNDVPYFESDQLAEVKGDQTSELALSPAIDLDSESLVYELVSQPSNATIENCLNGTNDLLCDFTPNVGFRGELSFSIRAFDGKNYSINQNITVTVLSPPIHTIQIASGGSQACAVLNNGDLYCWGSNFEGQLGYGHTSRIGDNELPASAGKVSVGAKVKKVTIGGAHTCVLLESNDAKCWGNNYFGQLGQGNKLTIGDNELPSSIPVISLGAKVKDISTGNGHTCALLESDEVKCWGNNYHGQLGQGNTLSIGDNELPSSIPVINLGAKVKQLALGLEHTCALLEAGDVKCWGRNGEKNCYDSCPSWNNCSQICSISGQGVLGVGRLTIIGDDELPSAVENVELGAKAIFIAASSSGTCAVLENNKLRCWGDNSHGSLGYGVLKTIGMLETPIAIDPIDVGLDVKKVSMNDVNTCVLSTTNEVKCWGRNSQGQLGQGNTVDIGDNERPSDIGEVQLELPVKDIAVAKFSTCVLLENNKIKCWGDNRSGQLGLGHTQNIGDNELPSESGYTSFEGSSPVANINVADNTYRAPVNIIFNGLASTPSDSNGSIVNYEWNFGGGVIGEGAVTNHTFAKAGTYVIRLMITDDQGASGVAYRNLTILSEPMPNAVISASKFSGNVSLRVLFNGSWSTPSEVDESIVSYEWDMGDGSIYTDISPEHIYTETGVYTVRLTVTDSKNRISTTTRTIAAFDSLPPTASFAYTLGEPRAPVEVSFDAAASIPGSFDGAILKYEWDFGDQIAGSGQTLNHLYTQGGIYNVVLKITDDRGKTNSTTIPIEILPDQVASVIGFDTNSGVRPLVVNFNGSDSLPTFPTGEIRDYKWFINDLEVSSSEIFSYTFTEQGIYTIKLVVLDDIGKSAFSTKQITVLPKNPPNPQIDIISETTYPHVPVDISLDASNSTAGSGVDSIASYHWSMGDGTYKSGIQVSHRYNSPGTYQIQLTVENSDGENATKIISKTFYDSLMINVGTNYSAIFEGNWSQFKGIVRDHEGKIVPYPIQWISSDPLVLAIMEDGRAEGKAEGYALITAKVANNSSSAFRYEVKKKKTAPALMVDSNYFLKSYEEEIEGGAFGLTLYPYVTSEFSSYLKSLVHGSGQFYRSFSLLPGLTEINLTSYSGATVAGESTVNLRYFDGHGKALSFDGVDDQAILDISGTDTVSDKLDISLWLRLSDVSVAGKIFDISDLAGNGIKFEFDYKKTPIIFIDSLDYPVFISGNELRANEWTHFVISIDHDSKIIRVIQNGAIVAEKKYFSEIPWKGKNLTGVIAGEMFKGLIDELQLFNVNLNPDQVSSLMFTNKVTGLTPKVQFSFNSEATQRYSGSLTSTLTLGMGNGYDAEDPSLRFASTVLASRLLTANGGGIISTSYSDNEQNSLSKLSLEVPPFALGKDTDITIELLDAKTSGFLPKAVKGKEYLLRIHPVNGEPLKSSGILTLPLNPESLRKYGSFNLFHYEKGSGSISMKSAININVNEQIATFPISSFGTYFSSYDSSLYPKIEYFDPQVSDDVFTGQFDRKMDAIIKVTGSGPFNFEIQGSASDATIIDTVCEQGDIIHNFGKFPLLLSGIPLGVTRCQVYFRKAIDEKNYINISHMIYLSLKN